MCTRLVSAAWQQRVGKCFCASSAWQGLFTVRHFCLQAIIYALQIVIVVEVMQPNMQLVKYTPWYVRTRGRVQVVRP